MNLKALQLLEEGKFTISQDLFKRNAALYPSHITYNNLGRYLAEFGNERRDGRVVSARKLAFRYFKKSIELKPNIMAYRNLAYFSYELYLYENGDLKDAEKYQSEVLKLHYNHEDVYNYSVILYECRIPQRRRGSTYNQKNKRNQIKRKASMEIPSKLFNFKEFQDNIFVLRDREYAHHF